MKKVLLVVALACAGIANAQKGTVLVQGSVQFDHSKNSGNGYENKSTTSTLSPQVGYQFNDHWTAGILATFGFSKSTSTTEPESSESKTTEIDPGVFLRYTKKLNETFSVYGELESGYTYLKSTNNNMDGIDSVDFTSQSNGYFIQVNPAIYLNVWKNLGVNFNIGGISYGSSKNDDNKRSGLDITFGRVLGIGISKNF
jgi:hypothetical protein